MSFNFEWPEFSESFYQDAREMLAQALNKGQKPPIIADRIEVKELNMGTIPPELEILEIGDLSTDRFRGIFRLTYSGDAYIVLQTKVQANPLNVPRPSLDILGSPRILFAAAPLVVPMTLRLSSLQLRAIVVLVVSRQKGITLVFKNDPLESVDVSSSFDGVESVAGFIQREIEAQLREAFRSDLPSVIHRLSQKWLSGEIKSATGGGEGAAAGGMKARGGFERDAKIETRTAYVGGEEGVTSQGMNGKNGGGRGFTRRMDAPMSEMGESVELDSTWSTFGTDAQPPTPSIRSARMSPSIRSMSRSQSSSSSPALRHDQLESVPESIEAYDPTYGLRPDSIPHHAGFAEYRKLVRAGSSKRGLGDVLETNEDGRDEADNEEEGMQGHPQRVGDGSFDFDMIGLRDLVEDDENASSIPPRSSLDSAETTPAFYETIPAVGGGTITRPRVFHTQSQIRMRTESTGSASAHGSPSSVTARSVGGGSSASTVGLGRAATFARSASLSRIPTTGRPEDVTTPSVASTPRFPFPRYPHVPPPAYSAAGGSISAPSLTRNQSMPSFSRRQTSNTIHRSNLSWQLSASSTSNEAASSRFPPQYTSPALDQRSLSTPLSSPSKALKPLPSSSGEPLSFTRPSPVDLLSRSPSSVLNTSFLDEEHLPITLNPGSNDSCAHLKTLSTTNQTLSPFTRENELVMARSSPRPVTPSTMAASGGRLAPTAPLAREGGRVVLGNSENRGNSGSTPMPPVKATRKRLHRIGSAKPTPPGAATSVSASNESSARRGGTSSVAPSSVYSPRMDSTSRSRQGGGGSIPMSHRKMPSLSVNRSGGGGLGVGVMGSSSRAPSELSEYFPSTGSGTGGAREMLSRFKLS
ncbi:ERMES complex subunit MDM34 [Sporobolomyces salmoneus]|uniref:ERMES complex subunit MDM34 n=1 Tax=Sporobolomyces salmoneus TaxID=183962 RepID=UPI00317F10D4